MDPTTITAYPVDPTAIPIGDHWTQSATGWTHPLHSSLLPRSTTAAHYVLAGVTSRNELLLINLSAAVYLGIEGADPTPLMRSWLMQILATTPEAQVAVDDPDLMIMGAPRITLIPGPAATPDTATVLFAAGHTSGPAAPITVSGQAATATNVVLCNGPAAGIYIANRYWPMWRRMELTENQWGPMAVTLTDATEKPASSVDDTSPATLEATEEPRAPTLVPPPATPPEPTLTSNNDTSPLGGEAELTPAAEVFAADTPPHPGAKEGAEATIVAGAGAVPPQHPTVEDAPIPATPTPLATDTPDEVAQDLRPEIETSPPAPADLPGPPRSTEAPQRGLFALGETYALGVDPDTGDPVKHPAVTRQGVRKPIKALMMLATSSGLTTPEWDKELQFNPPNRRQARTTIRKLIGGDDPIREDSRGLLVTDLYCDWKEFQRLAGPVPTQASTEDLTAAVALIRGAPFEDIPAGDYGWRSAELLRDELLDRCSDAAIELARRQQAAGAATLAYNTARLGIRVYPQREDLWEVALATATDTERPGLLYDLKQAIPAPRTPELRQLLAEARTR